jgi:hypothetical protein
MGKNRMRPNLVTQCLMGLVRPQTARSALRSSAGSQARPPGSKSEVLIRRGSLASSIFLDHVGARGNRTAVN